MNLPESPFQPFKEGVKLPHNLGITRELALTVCIVSLVIAIGGLTIATETGQLDEKTTATVTSLMTTFGVLLMTLVSALKSTEAADTASKTTKEVKQLRESVDGHNHEDIDRAGQDIQAT